MNGSAATATPRGRARLVLVTAACVLVMHAVHLALLWRGGDLGSRGSRVVLGSASVWAAVLVRQLAHRARSSEAQTATAFVLGSAALTADGAWSGSPGHPVLIAVGLVSAALGVTAFTSGRTALVGTAAITGCQVALVVVTQGGTLMGWYVAVSAATVTATVCTSFTWIRARLQRALQSLEDLALHDPLTGLLNRRGLSEGFPEVRRRAAAQGHRAAVVLVDLDGFKSVNDTHGHDTGDRVLQAVAAVLRASARQGDLVVRLGGEELAWVGSWSRPEQALAAADRLLAAVRTSVMPHGARVTTSAGVAFPTDATHRALDAEALSRLLVRADDALYEAKRTGRDRVVLAPPRVADGSDPHGSHAHGGAPAPRVRDGGSRGASAAGAVEGPEAAQRA